MATALRQMRESRSQLAIVTDADGKETGLLSVNDIMLKLLPLHQEDAAAGAPAALSPKAAHPHPHR